MSEFWDSKLVTPLKHAEIEAEYDAAEDKDEFCERFVNTLNARLEDMIQEGKDKAYPNYTISLFQYTESASASTPRSISYGASSRPADPLHLAIAQAQFKCMKAEHEKTMALYEGYDYYYEPMVKLTDATRDCGGDIEFCRPYFRVTLPSEPDGLQTTCYEIPGLVYYVKALKAKLKSYGARHLTCEKD